MPRPLCTDSEDVLRAINEANWDPKEKRPTSGLFRGKNISLSRLAVLEFDEIVAIFRKELTKCPLLCVGEINVGHLRQIGKDHGIALTVEQDPLDENPAHAEIPGEIKSRKIALAIAGNLKLHDIGQTMQPIHPSAHDLFAPLPSQA